MSILQATTPYSKLVKERAQIVAAQRTTEEEIRQAHADVTARRAELGEQEAESVLTTPVNPTQLQTARSAVRSAVETVENLEARQAALNYKLNAKSTALLDLEPSIVDSRFQAIERRTKRWREDYRKAALAFQQSILVGQVLARLSGDGGLFIVLADSHAPDPDQSDMNVLSTRPLRTNVDSHGYDLIEAWEQNSVAVRENTAARHEVEAQDQALAVIKEIRRSL